MKIGNINNTNFKGNVIVPGTFKNKKIHNAIYSDLTRIIDTMVEKPYDLHIQTKEMGVDYLKLTATNEGYVKENPVDISRRAWVSKKSLSKNFDKLVETMDSKLNIQA